MKRLMTYMLLPLLLFAHGTALPQQENASDGAPEFSVIRISGGDIPEYLLDEACERIRKGLAGFVVNDECGAGESLSFKKCFRGDCARSLAEIMPGGIVVIVSISSYEVVTGQRQLTRYLVEDITETRYAIYAAAVDTVSLKYDVACKKTARDPELLEQEADEIARQIRDYYIGMLRQ